jgi:hypothetical protein
MGHTVGLAMQHSHATRLAGGLSVNDPTDRALYVAGTRARVCTVALWAEAN